MRLFDSEINDTKFISNFIGMIFLHRFFSYECRDQDFEIEINSIIHTKWLSFENSRSSPEKSPIDKKIRRYSHLPNIGGGSNKRGGRAFTGKINKRP